MSDCLNGVVALLDGAVLYSLYAFLKTYSLTQASLELDKMNFNDSVKKPTK